MDVEFSVSSAHAKAKVLTALRDRGHRADTGAVRLAYPFAIVVDVGPTDLGEVHAVVAALDPGAGMILTPTLAS